MILFVSYVIIYANSENKPVKGIIKCQKKQDLQEQILMWHQMI